ncbi:hypothetical protein KCU73_g128, partial [Aureobasidium melanogenum]
MPSPGMCRCPTHSSSYITIGIFAIRRRCLRLWLGHAIHSLGRLSRLVRHAWALVVRDSAKRGRWRLVLAVGSRPTTV